MKPKVSVILTSYNHEKYIAEAIESVLNQTFANFELLIADDGSSDNSREVIKSFSDTRIKLFLHENNRGPRIILQELLNVAQGKYIAIHHSDDTWITDKLEKQINFLDSHENYAACFTWANFIDEQSKLQELADGDFYKKIFEQENKSRAEWLRYFFYNANCLCHPSLMIRKNLYKKYKLADFHGLWQLPDFYMWTSLAFHENFYIMPERLVNFRLRKDNMSAASFDKRIRVESEMFFIMNNFIENFQSNKFFLEVFPDAKKFLIGNKIIREFAFAKICLENFSPATQLVGLNLLKNLLSDNKTATEIKNLYNYDEKNFLADTGKHDIFNLQKKFETIHATIYFDERGEKSIEQNILIEDNGNFHAKFFYNAVEPINYLRFDPDNNFISIKLERFTINDENYNFNTNGAEFVEDFYNFMTNDPQFIFDVKNLQGNLIIEISGVIKFDYLQTVSEKIISMRKEKILLEEKVKKLEKKLTELKKLNDDILNSTLWKITAPLRKISKIIK